MTTEINHYFDDTHPLRPYTHSAPASPGTMPPANALRGEAPTASPGFHPAEKNGVWTQIEDHRGAEGYLNEEPYSIKDFGPLPEGWSIDPPPPPPLTPEEIAEVEYSAARAEASAILTARAQRELMQEADFTGAEYAIFAKAGLFPAWTVGESYTKGNRVVHEGIVYEVQQPVTAQAHQPPGSTGMLAVYRPISVDAETGDESDGSRERPIPFIIGMDTFKDKYYTWNEKLYLALQNAVPCIWEPQDASALFKVV